MDTGVYYIQNKDNKKIYFGCGILEDRIRTHQSQLKRGKHPNDHLQYSFDKYGREKFNFEIIKYCRRDAANIQEKLFIENFKTYIPKYGYNKTKGGDQFLKGMKGELHPAYGVKRSEEMKRTIALKNSGVNGPNSKLTENDVRFIRRMSNKGEKVVDIADILGVTPSTVSSVRKGETWKNVDHFIEKDYKTRKVMDREKVSEIKKMLLNHELTTKEIAEKAGVNPGKVRDISANRSWTDVEPKLDPDFDRRSTIPDKVRGENSPAAKLNKKQVKEIKEILKDEDRTMASIGEQFNVSEGAIFSIKHNETWTHVEV